MNKKKSHPSIYRFFMDVSGDEGILRTEKEGESKIRAGDAVLLMPCELHQSGIPEPGC
jgi:hypothetical protein